MMQKIGAVLEGPAGARARARDAGGAERAAERARVRRGSRLKGRCEGAFWRRTDRAEVRRVVQAARQYDRVGRQPGRPSGPLGHVALEALELLANLVDFRTGRLEPALTFLMSKLRRSRGALVRALAALRRHGFLDWMRRYEETGLEGRGPRVRQVSNAYRLSLPERARRLLGARGEAPPLPDDTAHGIEERVGEVKAMKAGLALDELALVEVEDGPLARVLAQMGRRLQERESTGQTEAQAKGFL